MSHPDYDPTEDAIALEDIEDVATRNWINVQMDKLAQIRAEQAESAEERKAVLDELLPVLTKLGRPLRWRDPITHEESIVKPVTAETKTVDLDKLFQLTPPENHGPILDYVKQSISFADLERLVGEGVVSMEVAAEVTQFKAKAPYVKF